MLETQRAGDAAERPPPNQRLLEAWDALDSGAISVVSTDVFDTLVWRKVPEPTAAFPLIGARLAQAGRLGDRMTADAFGRIRKAAEDRARRDRLASHGETEVTLREIHDRIPVSLFAPGMTVEELMEAELDTEHALIVPDLDVLALLEAARERGKAVIAVSDTYFSSEHLESLLRQPLLEDLELDRVFSSSEHRVNKSGGLFDLVLARMDVTAGEVLHLGDNRQADVEVPGAMGIRCVYFPHRPEPVARLYAREHRYRRGLPAVPAEHGDAGNDDWGLTALRAKMLAHPEGHAIPEALRPFWSYGAVTLGPVLTGFGQWVCERAEDLGVRRVFPLMREGEFLTRLVHACAASVGSDVRATPLWLNRSVCARAAIGAATRDELDLLCEGRTPPTVGEVVTKLGLRLADVPSFAGQADTRLGDPVVRAMLLDELREREEVRLKIVEGARQLRERVIEYLRREAGEDGQPLVLVDLGWGASIQTSLVRALRHAGQEGRVAGLYLLTHGGATAGMLEGAEIHGFLADFGAPDHAAELVVRQPEVLEQICMADRGTQLDLGPDLEPVLADHQPHSLQAVEADAVRKGVLAFGREWTRYATAVPRKLRSLSTAREVLLPALLRSVASPTEEEATLLGSWHHDEGRGSSRSEEIAGTELADRVRYLDPDQLRSIPMTDLYWPFGLLARVDADWAQLASMAASGELPWEMLSAPLGSGRFEVRASAGVGIEHAVVSAVPRRNRLGLSMVRASLRAAQVAEVALRPSERPCLLRVDWLELRIWMQGEAEPVTVRLESPRDFTRLAVENCFFLSPNVLVCHDHHALVTFDVAGAFAPVAHRVDVELAFAGIELAQLPGGQPGVPTLHGAEAELAALRRSASWRVTAPLRAAKRMMRER